MIWIIVKVAAIGAAFVAGLLLLNNWDTLSERARNSAPAPHRVLQVAYGQPVPTRQVVLFPEPLGRMGGMRPHACPYEDGDPSGRPCIWTNPRTQLGYFIDSTEYLD